MLIRAACLAGALSTIGCGTLLAIDPEPRDGGGDAAGAADGGTEGGADGGTDGPTAELCDRPTGCTLAGALAAAIAVSVDGTHVYFTRYESTGGAILRLPKTGGPIERVYDPAPLANGVAAAPEGVYWTQEGDTTVRFRSAASMAGQDSGSLGNVTLNVLNPPGGLALGGGRVFWTLPSNGSIHGSSLQLQSPVEVRTSLTEPRRIVADATWLYAASGAGGGRLSRSPHNGSFEEVAKGLYSPISALAATAQSLTVASQDGVFRLGTSSAEFMGTAVSLSTAITGATGLAIDEAKKALYAITAGGVLHRLDLTGKQALPTELPTEPCSSGRGIAQDATRLYLACGDAILSVPKT